MDFKARNNYNPKLLCEYPSSNPFYLSSLLCSHSRIVAMWEYDAREHEYCKAYKVENIEEMNIC